jgi:hypothetical protein
LLIVIGQMVRRSGAAIGVVADLFSPLRESVRDAVLSFVDHFALPANPNGPARFYIFRALHESKSAAPQTRGKPPL